MSLNVSVLVSSFSFFFIEHFQMYEIFIHTNGHLKDPVEFLTTDVGSLVSCALIAQKMQA